MTQLTINSLFNYELEILFISLFIEGMPSIDYFKIVNKI